MERSRNNAYYTSPEPPPRWSRGCGKGCGQAGADKLDNPTVLEPSAGSGRFLEMQPRDRAAQSNRVEVEPNPLTNSLQVFWDARVGLREGFAKDSGRLFTRRPWTSLPSARPVFGLVGRSIVERRRGLSCPMRLYRLPPAELMPMSTA